MLLVVVFLLVRFLSIRIPLRPFFLATSALLAVLAFSFTGSGIKELQEGNVLPVTPVPGIPTIDLLGIYPTVETLTAQAAVLALLITLFVLELRRSRQVSPVPEPTPLETPS